MAKKRRKERKQLSRERGMQQAAANVSLIDTHAPLPAQPKQGASPRESGASSAALASIEEYAYIRSDLKRIAILSISIFVILVALSFAI